MYSHTTSVVRPANTVDTKIFIFTPIAIARITEIWSPYTIGIENMEKLDEGMVISDGRLVVCLDRYVLARGYLLTPGTRGIGEKEIRKIAAGLREENRISAVEIY